MSNYFRANWRRSSAAALLVATLFVSAFVLFEKATEVFEPSALEIVEKEAHAQTQTSWGAGVVYLDGVLADPGAFALEWEDLPSIVALRDVLSDEEKNRFNESLRIEVECDRAPYCRLRAEEYFQEAMSHLETSDTLEAYPFVYFNLLAVRLYLFEAEIWTLPEEFEGWQEAFDRSHDEMDRLFIEQRLRFHQHLTRERHDEARHVLEDIKLAFPHTRSREHRWALHQDEELNARVAPQLNTRSP